MNPLRVNLFFWSEALCCDNPEERKIKVNSIETKYFMQIFLTKIVPSNNGSSIT